MSRVFQRMFLDYRYLRMNLVDTNPDAENIKIIKKELEELTLLRDRIKVQHKLLKEKLKEIKIDTPQPPDNNLDE